MPSLRIILVCMASAVLYGIAQDQVTARVCVEYFTVGHKPLFATDSPTLLALDFGTRATWWAGVILGISAALLSRAGSWPKLDATRLIRPIACLLTVMAVASLLAGLTGYQVAKGGGFVLPEPLGPRVPKVRHALFFADSLAHLAAYGVGTLGGFVLCAGVIVQRRRMARAEAPPNDGRARVDLLGAPWAIAAGRWTARTVGIPLFVLLVLLTLGDGLPNPLTASRRENLFGIVILMMLFGLVLAWKWEGIGGLLILGGLALFAAANEPFLFQIVFTPWLVTGLLYLACWAGRRWGGRPRDGLSFPLPSPVGRERGVG